MNRRGSSALENEFKKLVYILYRTRPPSLQLHRKKINPWPRAAFRTGTDDPPSSWLSPPFCLLLPDSWKIRKIRQFTSAENLMADYWCYSVLFHYFELFLPNWFHFSQLKSAGKRIPWGEGAFQRLERRTGISLILMKYALSVPTYCVRVIFFIMKTL